MGYKTDGSSHSDGISNEENLIERLQTDAQQLYPNLSDDYQVVKRGGTKFKQDMEIVDGNRTILISAKKKTAIGKGSFDWVNSSSVIKTIEPLRIFAQTVKSVGETYSNKDTARSAVKSAGNKALRELTSSEVSDLLREHVSKKNSNMRVIISETSTGNNWEYKFDDSPLHNSIQNHTPSLRIRGTGTSAKIIFKDSEGNTIDHGLRIRIVTNNGIGALIGQGSGANKSSRGVVKIQQDNIPGLISGLKNKIRKF